ncbi:hypothetical protein U1Q18_007061 [Sarracenia purpurea var. burkii]
MELILFSTIAKAGDQGALHKAASGPRLAAVAGAIIGVVGVSGEGGIEGLVAKSGFSPKLEAKNERGIRVHREEKGIDLLEFVFGGKPGRKHNFQFFEKQVKHFISERKEEPYKAGVSASCSHQPNTFFLGFSKGGTILNQLVTELGFSPVKSSKYPPNLNTQLMNGGLVNIKEANRIVPISKASLLNSITEIHYVDVGLNSAGAYLTDGDVMKRLFKRVMQGAVGIRFVLHGTPTQWCDS